MNSKDLVQNQITTETVTKTRQNIDLVNGEFNLDDASEVIMALLDQKLNFHKAKRFQLWTRDNKFDSERIDRRIAELEHAKAIVKDFLTSQESKATRLHLHADLNISVIEE